MAQIFEVVKPGDLITADIFNKMAKKIEELFDRIAAIERTDTGTISGMVREIQDSEISSPIIGAKIYAESGNITYSSTPTTELGNYSITNLLPGIYRVWAESENCARSKMETVSVTAASTITVNFGLSFTVNLVVIPDVQGKSLSEAFKAISRAGLQTGIVLDAHNNVIDPANSEAASLLVINQNLAPGDTVPFGTKINIFLTTNAEIAIPPTILEIKPSVGKVGDEVELIGFGFGSEKGIVTFSGIKATFIPYWKSNSIKVKVPDNSISGDIQVINSDDVSSNTSNFIIKTGFTVPDIRGRSLSEALNAISRAGLQTGIILDIHNNIIDPDNSEAASLLVINQNLAPGDNVPPGTKINIFLTTYTEIAIPPTILEIKPSVGKVGDEVELIGFGFGTEKGIVTFSGMIATFIPYWKSNSIKVKVPDNAISGDIQVINSDDVRSNPFYFTLKPKHTGYYSNFTNSDLLFIPYGSCFPSTLI